MTRRTSQEKTTEEPGDKKRFDSPRARCPQKEDMDTARRRRLYVRRLFNKGVLFDPPDRSGNLRALSRLDREGRTDGSAPDQKANR